MGQRTAAVSTDDRIVVQAAAANVRRGDAPLRLSRRERELAIATAVQSHPASAEALGRLLFPDREDDDAANVVKVYVYRLRQRVGANFIVTQDGGYAVGPGVQVDITQARQFLDQVTRSDKPLAAGERERMLEVARGLMSGPPAPFLEGEWYEAVWRRARRLGHDLALRIGRNALDHGALLEASIVGRELTYEDPCDEEAWELLIRTQLRLGEHPAAFRNFRRYEEALARELDAAPSAPLRQLIDDARERMPA